jgi:hypothetical protein
MFNSAPNLRLVPTPATPAADGADVLRRAQSRFKDYLSRHASRTPEQLARALEKRASRRGMPPQIAELLVFERLATPAEIKDALACGQGVGELGETLVGAGLLTAAALRHLHAQRIGIPCVDLDHFPVDERAVARVPPNLARRRLVMPIHELDVRTVVVVSDLRDRQALEAARRANPAGVELAIAPAVDLAEAIDRYLDADLTLPAEAH